DGPPEERLVEDARARVPLERDADRLGVVPARAQVRDEIVGHQLRPAVHERDLRPADDESHRCSRREMRSSRSSISFSTASLKARWSASAGSTYQRIRRRSKSFTGLALPTTGRSPETGRGRSAWCATATRS